MKKKLTMSPANSLTLEKAYDLFVRKATVGNLSKNTLKTYYYHFSLFSKFLGADTLIFDVKKESVESFVLHLRDSPTVNDITINSYLRTIRTFLYYCMDCGYLAQYKIPIPKAEKKIKGTYTDEELSKLLKKPDKVKCTFTEFKLWAFENYLIGTGNRISSALNLKICDVDFDAMMITIRKTKNRNQQIIPLSNALSKVLKDYLLVRGGCPDDYLFCNAYGEQGKRRTFQQEIAKYNIRRNVNKTSCHLFRHTFAKNWILNGGDIFRLQKILGHSDLSIVKEYVNLFSNDLSIDFERYNPLDRLSGNADRIKINPPKSP